MNLKEIKDLIELVSDKGFAEFEIERQGFRLRISRFKESQPQIMHPAPAPIIISSGIPSSSEIHATGSRRALSPLENTQSATSNTAAQKVSEPEQADLKSDLQIINSPIVGTFYRASSPTSEPFVKIGDHVDPDSVVCIIEAMKLMNEIQAELSGEVVRIFVESGQPVEFGQPLFGIKT
jgi:acetyl-CoA carboxylase biotin carboxyl carrier protein